ncbi:TetR family transcriptional regulator [Allonocardiopsis opalescens]|uniref:TetR family transcriptional regulator n=1 Tax=Allonocardiopsis opalescens TaxID=1144618 RepID=A0A2T0PV86_9ACTN|nr:TetR family transcriptional regulator [Allonocardiopsis opalescens]PRX95441.1 TetR family transcriptional regulator [Allonocardiopsis opalescens]
MRADAARNREAVLLAGARLLYTDPSAGMAAIAAAAGVDRRTVYRHFPDRAALLAGVHAARLTAIERAFDDARLDRAPIAVALHRLAEGVIAASRRWPVDTALLDQDEAARVRSLALAERLDEFVQRAVREGLLRGDLPTGWARSMVVRLLDLAAHQLPTLGPAPAADVVVRSLLDGIGAPV